MEIDLTGGKEMGRMARMNGVKTIICPNPECKREHGLFWNVSGEKKKVLSYRCEKQRIKVKTGQFVDGVEQFTYKPSRSAIPAPEGIVPAKDVPEYWTPSYRKKATFKKNLQFTLMNK